MSGNEDGTASGESARAAEAVAEVRRCRNNIAAGNLAHAASHIGYAIAHDPAAGSVYDALSELAAAAGSSEAARQLLKGDGTNVFIGNAAAIIALLAGEGEVATAVELFAGVVAMDPATPWAAAPWFGPALGADIPPVSVGRAVSTIWRAVGNPAPPDVARALTPWLDLSRAVAARADTGSDVLAALSALARRLGVPGEAVAWCQAAERIEARAGAAAKPGTLIMLGYAYRDDGRPAQAIEVWKRAASVAPHNADLLLDLADLTFDQGDFAESVCWAEQAAGIDGTAVKPWAALRAARFRAGVHDGLASDIKPLIELVDLARARPEVAYLRTEVSRACAGARWLQVVPEPTEAIAGTFGEMAAIEESGEGEVTGARVMSSTLESPSAMSIFQAHFPQATVEVLEVPAPDMRIPVTTDFGPPLWAYLGTEAVPNAGRPSPEAIERLYQITEGIWADPLAAYEQAAGFAGLEGADLLGLLAHVPPPRAEEWRATQRQLPLYWQRLAQAWVCIGILHHRSDEPWNRSARRTLLLRLLFGPEDWTVDAAAFALCVGAWHFPDHRTEIAGAITQRYQYAARAVGKRPTQLHDSLAGVLLICPGVDPKVARLARKRVAERQGRPDMDSPSNVGSDLLRIWKRRNSG